MGRRRPRLAPDKLVDAVADEAERAAARYSRTQPINQA
jgi:hypothetical protein